MLYNLNNYSYKLSLMDILCKLLIISDAARIWTLTLWTIPQTLAILVGTYNTFYAKFEPQTFKNWKINWNSNYVYFSEYKNTRHTDVEKKLYVVDLKTSNA